MRKITVDFSLQTYPLFAGYVGEHNATELTAIKPVDLEGVTYSLAFMTNGEVIHSEFFGADEEIKVTLWQQLTLDNDLYVQLEAYDENGKYLGKSGMVKLVLSNSVHGIDRIADADNPDVYAEIAQNSAFRKTLEDNAELLNELTAMTTTDILKLFRDGTEPDKNSFVGGLAIKRFLQTLELYYVTRTKLDEMIEEDLPKSRATAQKVFTQDDMNFTWVVDGKTLYILFFEEDVNIPIGTEIADVEFMFAESEKVPNGVYISLFDMFKYGELPYNSMVKSVYLNESYGNVMTAIHFPEGLNAVASEIDKFMWTSARITYYTD